jgi:hypothetical protein
MGAASQESFEVSMNQEDGETRRRPDEATADNEDSPFSIREKGEIRQEVESWRGRWEGNRFVELTQNSKSASIHVDSMILLVAKRWCAVLHGLAG